MTLNQQGKIQTIFLVLILVLLAASTAIGFFLYNKESELRRNAEKELEKGRYMEMKLQADLKEARHQLAVAEDKKKEVDDKINGLMDEVELNEGLRKELKNENAALKEAIETAKKDREKYKLEVDAAERRFKEITELYKSEQDKRNALQQQLEELKEAKAEAEEKAEGAAEELKPVNQRSASAQVAGEVPGSPAVLKDKVELDKIVVNPNDGTRGRVLSVDKEAEFIVNNLGVKQGIKMGDVLSVFRGEEYLGDVKVSRVQEELSAADLIPPFSSRKVRKNDIVVFKP